MNVGLVVLAAASAWLVAGLAIASALGPRLRESAEAAGDLPLGTAADRGPSGRIRWLLPASVVGMAFASSTGLAAAGALPKPVQVVASNVFSTVGVDVPPKREPGISAAAPRTTTSPAAGGPVAAPAASPQTAAQGDGGAPTARSRRADHDEVLGRMIVEQGPVAPLASARDLTAAVPPAPEPSGPVPAAGAPSSERGPQDHAQPHPPKPPAVTPAPADPATGAPVTAVADGEKPTTGDEHGRGAKPTTTGGTSAPGKPVPPTTVPPTTVPPTTVPPTTVPPTTVPPTTVPPTTVPPAPVSGSDGTGAEADGTKGERQDGTKADRHRHKHRPRATLASDALTPAPIG
jgi:hypothetical protein